MLNRHQNRQPDGTGDPDRLNVDGHQNHQPDGTGEQN
jgi:hypothetical protein